MSSLNIQVPDKLGFLYEPSRYKVAYGGRGAAKSWGFADALLITSHQREYRNLCAREHMDSIKESVHQLLKDRIGALGLSVAYDIQNSVIKHRFNGSIFSFSGLRINPEDLKSFEGYDRCWIEEGRNVTKKSLDILTPTIRKSGSEIWISFNTELETDEVYDRFVLHRPVNCVTVEVNWRDNPWFNDVLEAERVACLERDPDGYLTIWEGKPRVALEGAIYAKEMRALIARGAVCRVPYEESKPVHMAWDLGWGDSMAIVLWQQVGYEYRILGYIEDDHRTVASYAKELKEKPYSYGHIYLPHDGANHNIISGTSAEEVLVDQFPSCKVHIVPAVDETTQIAAVRNVFAKAVFEESGTVQLRNRLATYKYGKHSDGSSTRLPVHDASSHGCKAFACMAVGYDQGHDRPKVKVGNQHSPSSSSWMAS